MCHAVVRRDTVSYQHCVLLVIRLHNNIAVRAANNTVAPVMPLVLAALFVSASV
jgi:hypothetical protein